MPAYAHSSIQDSKALPCDGLIFDLDGTLWDASGTCTLAWNRTLEMYGYSAFRLVKKQIHRFSGQPLEKIIAENFDFLRPTEYARFAETYRQNEATLMAQKGGRLYPGVRAGLQTLDARLPLFIVSNCQKGYIENFLRIKHLYGRFLDFECSGNTGMSKAANLRVVIARNHLTSPVFLGDTIWDGEAAQANGIPFVFCSYGFGQLEEAPLQVRNFSELESLVRPLDRS